MTRKHHAKHIVRRLSLASLAIAGIALGSWAGTGHASVVNTFQQGVDGYTGHEDAPINTVNGGDRNFGGDGEATVGRNAGNDDNFRVVQRWDLSSLDTSPGVQSATLDLTLKDKGVGGSQGTGKAFLFALKSTSDAWIEGTGTGGVNSGDNGASTWNFMNQFGGAANPQPGDTAWPGGQGAGPGLTSGGNPPAVNNGYFVDPMGEVTWDTNNDSAGDVKSISLSGVAGIGDGSLTALIDHMGTSDAGFVMVSDAEGGSSTQRFFYHTSEASTASDRPLLTVTVIPEPTSLALFGLGGLALLRRRRA